MSSKTHFKIQKDKCDKCNIYVYYEGKRYKKKPTIQT